jgi:O-antigen/teichoic acid export membrane protein
MTDMRRYRWLASAKSPLALAVIDQAVLSAFSLGLNIFLIRLWLPEAFGFFVMVFSLSLIGSSIQGALIGTQLAVLRPQALERSEEPQLLTSLWTANCLLTAATVLVSSAAVAFLWRQQMPILALATGLFVGGMLVREYVRSLLFSEPCPATVLITDLIFIAVSMIALALVWRCRDALGVAETLIAMAGASAVSCLPAVSARREQFSFRINRQVGAQCARVWGGQARWALLGAMTYEVMSRAHVFVVGSWFGAASLGILQAGEMLFRPLVLLIQAWERIAKPMFARLAAGKDIAAARALTFHSLIGAFAAAALFFVVLYLCWPLLNSHLFRRSYDSIELVAALWALAAVTKLVTQVYGTELQGFARFGELSAIGVIAALASLVLLLATVLIGTFEWSILAVIGGNLVALGLIRLILSRSYRPNRGDGKAARKFSHFSMLFGWRS